MTVYCRICGAAGAACGDSHQTLPLLTAEGINRGTGRMSQQREELQEYHYYVSGIEMTAMLTEKMAKRLGAKPVGEPLDDPNNLENNEANRMSTGAQDVDTETNVTTKARRPRNKSGSGD
jgi:hypothetical protein